MATTQINGDSYYKAWYKKNKEELSLKRKRRYASDSAVRQQALDNAKKYREDHARPSTRGAPKLREVHGVIQQVYRISEAAELIGCSIEFLRKYEGEGVIPITLVDSPQRYYTGSQIKLMKAFFNLMSELKYNKDADLKAAALESHKATMQENW